MKMVQHHATEKEPVAEGTEDVFVLLCDSRSQGLLSDQMPPNQAPTAYAKSHPRIYAVMESFFGSLKRELVHHRHYRTREEARRDIFEYIELFYNRVKLHSALGYLSPVQFAAKENNKAA